MSRNPVSPFSGAMTDMRIARPADRVDEPAAGFDEAIRLMAKGRWDASFTRLAELADGGHPQAARIALLFVRRGTLLFGGTFHASAGQRRCWERTSD